MGRTLIGGAALTFGGAFLAGCGGSGPIRIGFIPLTDCVSVVMAQELGFYKKHGVDVQVVKQKNWAGTRDNLLQDDIRLAHCCLECRFRFTRAFPAPT